MRARLTRSRVWTFETFICSFVYFANACCKAACITDKKKQELTWCEEKLQHDRKQNPVIFHAYNSIDISLRCVCLYVRVCLSAHVRWGARSLSWPLTNAPVVLCSSGARRVALLKEPRCFLPNKRRA